MGDIAAGRAQFGRAADILEAHLGHRQYSSVHVLCDENTYEKCLPKLEEISVDFNRIIIPIGEEHKILATCIEVWRTLSEQGADRNSLLINLGGGVVTDLGGFCAASFMRGMPFLHIPTSILGMTDAAIGGKTGVDFDSFKNYIGFFKEPESVVIDTSFIETLDMRQRCNGLAEVLKHGFINDPGLVVQVMGYREIERVDWGPVLRRSIETKYHFIENDTYDRGLRAALNFGHTIGHAIESYSLGTNEPLHHGEAIALGMLVEARISQFVSGLKEEEVKVVEETIQTFFGGVRFPALPLDQLHQFIGKDKKKIGADVLYSLISALGEPMVGQKVPETVVNEAYLHYADR